MATRAACTRRQVGAVLVSPDHRILSCGYNGTPAGTANCSEGGCPRGKLSYEQLPSGAPYTGGASPCRGIHAELNALLHAGLDKAKGATLYSSQPPCDQCSVQIEACDVARVVWKGM